MRTRRCIRYICDHCSKGMFSRPAMEKHEKRCFHNPQRTVCGGCEIDGSISVSDHPIEEMIAAIVEKGIDAAKVIAEGCPACVCSALIQARKRAKKEGDDSLASYLWVDVQFDYKREMDAFCIEARRLRPEDYYP